MGYAFSSSCSPLFGSSGALLLSSGNIKVHYYRSRRQIRGFADEAQERNLEYEEEIWGTMQTIVLVFDACDPIFSENLLQQGRRPDYARFLSIGGNRRFEVTNPAQSEVPWTRFATGLNPGGYGIFDFVHRDPKTYIPHISLLPIKKGLGGVQKVPSFMAQTLFDQAAKDEYPAIRLFWPATLPAHPDALVRSISGLGTADILGRVGAGSYYWN